MRFLRERLGLIVLIGVVAGLLLYSLWLAGEARDRRYAPLPLSYSQHRFGVKGFARLLERNGYTVRSFKRTFRHLPNDAEMLVIFPPYASLEGLLEASPWTQEDADALERWLKNGGRLLLFSSDPRLPETLRADMFRMPSVVAPAEKFVEAQPALPASWLKTIRKLSIGQRRFAHFAPRKERWVPLLHAGGVAKGALWYYGNGVVFECADWQWLTNEHLRSADNGAFILAVVRQLLPQGGVIYFDDAGQGDLLREREARGFWAIAPMGVRIAFAHLLLLTVIVMYSVGKRFGLPRPTPPRAPALGEYVDALAGVYERAQATHAAFEVVLDDVRRKLCRRLGLPAGATLLQLIQSLPVESPLRDALAEAHHALQNPNLTPDEAIRILKRLEAS